MWVGAKAKGREGRSSKSNLLRRGKLVGTLVGLLRKKVCPTGFTKHG